MNPEKVIRLRINRLYKSAEEAERNVTWILKKKQETTETAEPGKYANQYEWMADHHMA